MNAIRKTIDRHVSHSSPTSSREWRGPGAPPTPASPGPTLPTRPLVPEVRARWATPPVQKRRFTHRQDRLRSTVHLLDPVLSDVQEPCHTDPTRKLVSAVVFGLRGLDTLD